MCTTLLCKLYKNINVMEICKGGKNWKGLRTLCRCKSVSIVWWLHCVKCPVGERSASLSDYKAQHATIVLNCVCIKIRICWHCITLSSDKHSTWSSSLAIVSRECCVLVS